MGLSTNARIKVSKFNSAKQTLNTTHSTTVMRLTQAHLLEKNVIMSNYCFCPGKCDESLYKYAPKCSFYFGSKLRQV
jgi:hypothetical protein